MLGRAIILFSPDTDRTDRQTVDSLYDIIDNPKRVWQREDALSDFLRLLGRLNISDEMSVSSVIDQFTIADGLCTAMTVLQLREEAFKLSSMWHEAIRRLAGRTPSVYKKHLARSLLGLSFQQSHVGKKEEALSTMKEVVEIYRTLTPTERQHALKADFACSLNSLSCRFGDVDRWDEALLAVEEALEIRRELAKGDPDASYPGLAESLYNRALYKEKIERSAGPEIMASIREAVELYQQLALRYPFAYDEDLQNSLLFLEDCLHGRGLGGT